MNNIQQFIHNNKSHFVWLVVVVLAFLAIYIGVRKISTHSVVIGHPSEIIVISPENSQDVIVIGNPDKINVKPKNKNK